ncbi:tRNA (adenosine(37)-N6)-threonylcarbamoyltransferase complex dimerization subunit type 1 TsaB [Culicoidibacter larvae]|uniref:tRNA (Adenosine(37)-N6)-threonylcarbamoyltransferase complex dimerization subunit type 1 TsaB n=1 Tax=Culicoidibacter larvae TaxID=2579976 RepID=A0A5R8QCA0_9FIRM|nr:tRNA (adenosine(37)-N6)-threonylcarbamoyltransferase complex dimerization subunit type 1 TsaB [Culicoidibacter larvae]TLG73910.1 tRNA (adenosine(37)-N6)-threonylcarbamoyltransferase complex dimerization subunit type 1 TsaB [Culicoidibacter larvae]
MKRLIINTALSELGIGLELDGVLFSSYGEGSERHSSSAMVVVEQLLKEHDVAAKEIDELVVVDGPGAFTGVRIGITIAKTWSFALRTPVKIVNSLEALAMQAEDGIVMPVLDAKRDMVFAAIYQKDGNKLASVLPEGMYTVLEASGYLQEYKAYSLGEAVSGMEVNQIIEPLRIDLQNVIALAEQRPAVEDIHALVPLYLKKSQAELEAER